MPFETSCAPADRLGDWQCQDDATVAVLTFLVDRRRLQANHNEALVDKESGRVTLDGLRIAYPGPLGTREKEGPGPREALNTPAPRRNATPTVSAAFLDLRRGTCTSCASAAPASIEHHIFEKTRHPAFAGWLTKRKPQPDGRGLRAGSSGGWMGATDGLRE